MKTFLERSGSLPVDTAVVYSMDRSAAIAMLHRLESLRRLGERAEREAQHERMRIVETSEWKKLHRKTAGTPRPRKPDYDAVRPEFVDYRLLLNVRLARIDGLIKSLGWRLQNVGITVEREQLDWEHRCQKRSRRHMLYARSWMLD